MGVNYDILAGGGGTERTEKHLKQTAPDRPFKMN